MGLYRNSIHHYPMDFKYLLGIIQSILRILRESQLAQK